MTQAALLQEESQARPAREITFTVFGTPVPQGSTRAFIPKGWKRPIITSDNTKLKPWRQEVAQTANDAMGFSQAFDRKTAVRVEARFYFAKPKSARKTDTHKTTKPDVDKLARSLFDSLTGIVIEDDAQITETLVSKLFGTPERVEVTVREV